MVLGTGLGTGITLGPIIGGTIVIVGAIWSVVTYNRFITLQNNVENAWSDIDVLLKQRADEIPNIIQTVKKYAEHEKEIFEHVSDKRAEMIGAESPQEKAQASAGLESALKSLFAVAENYPDLKADKNFRQLQDRITGIETQIATQRKQYNDVVTQYNTKQDQFPSFIVAGFMSSVEREDLFKVDRETHTAENAYSSLDKL